MPNSLPCRRPMPHIYLPILSLEMPNALECRYACRRCRIASRHFIHSVLVPTYVGIAWSTAARDPKIRSSGNLFSWCLSSVFSELFDKWPRRGIWFLSQENREWRRQHPRILVLPKNVVITMACCVGGGCWLHWRSFLFPPTPLPIRSQHVVLLLLLSIVIK